MTTKEDLIHLVVCGTRSRHAYRLVERLARQTSTRTLLQCRVHVGSRDQHANFNAYNHVLSCGWLGKVSQLVLMFQAMVSVSRV